MPAGISDSATAQRLDEVLALRDLVEQLQGVDLPQGLRTGLRELERRCPPTQTDPHATE